METERIFSVLKLIKVYKQSSLGNDTLKDLLVLNTDDVSMDNFNSDQSVDLWFKATTRHPNQKKENEIQEIDSS